MKSVLHPDWLRFLRGEDAEIFVSEIGLRADGEAPQRVLEIGSGDGYVASLLIEAGCDVTCTDPAPRLPAYCRVEPVKASRLPFPDGSFDAVVSSNVMEHVEDLVESFAEMRRVLRPGGVMIHSMPTPTCSLLTSLSAPLAYLRGFLLVASGRAFAGRDLSRPIPASLPASRFVNGRPRLRRILNRMLIACYLANPMRICRFRLGHGVASGPLDELFRWRDTRWREIFESNGLDVLRWRRGRLCYSMNKLFPMRLIGLRSFLARRGYAGEAFYILRAAEMKRTAPVRDRRDVHVVARGDWEW